MSEQSLTTNNLHCGACGAPIFAGSYRSLDGDRWCQRCAQRAEDEAHENYASEGLLGLVDLHAVVLDYLRWWEDMRSPEWPR